MVHNCKAAILPSLLACDLAKVATVPLSFPANHGVTEAVSLTYGALLHPARRRGKSCLSSGNGLCTLGCYGWAFCPESELGRSSDQVSTTGKLPRRNGLPRIYRGASWTRIKGKKVCEKESLSWQHSKAFFDVHLMVSEPEKWVKDMKVRTYSP
jgi:hypothetical protein